MIEYIQLRNFQSHKETEMEFHPGVNAIVGESDHGKTAIMRAFYWAIFGKPSGDSMRRHGTKRDTEVTIETAEHQISRIRGNSANQYIINDEVLKGFGQSVPQPVIDALNINEINFMRQLDPPFLFSKTAGEVAQYLNRLINLDVIDTSLSNIKRMHSQAVQSAEGHLAEVQRLEKALEGYAWTDEAEVAVARLEKKQVTVERMKKTADELDTILDEVFKYEQTASKYAYTKRLLQRVQMFHTEYESIQKDKEHYATLRNAVSLVKQTAAALHSLPATKGAEKALLALEKRIAARALVQEAYRLLDKAIEQWADAKNDVNLILAEHRRSVAQLKQAMPDVCPLCEQEIK